MIGRKYDDSALQKDIKLWPFKVINDNSKPKVEVKYKVGVTNTIAAYL